MRNLSQMSRVLMLAGLWLGAYALPCRAASFSAATSLSDSNVYPLPARPALPGVGKWFSDPTFGTRIMQLTDQTDDDTQTAYSYWPSMNSDSTRFWLTIDKVPPAPMNSILFDFDPAAETMARVGNLYTAFAFNPATAIWSWTEPNVIYGVAGDTTLRKMEITGPATRIYTTLKNMGVGLWQMTMSQDNRFFCWSQLPLGTSVKVWDRTLDIVYTRDVSSLPFDEAYIDLSGTYVVITAGANSKLWEFAAGPTLKDFNSNTSHGSVGYKKHFANSANPNPALSRWSTWDLTTPALAGVDNMANTIYSGIDKHTSWLTPGDMTWAYVGTFKSTLPWTRYQNEIIKVRTDGSGQWRRLAHTRSDSTFSYRNTPKGNISRDHRWFIYTSDWDTTLKAGQPFHYGFMLKVPTEAEFAAGNYGSDSIAPAAPRSLRLP